MSIDLATFQIEGLQFAGSLSDTVHFGMSRRVEVDGYTVGSLSDDDTVLGNHSTKRFAPVFTLFFESSMALCINSSFVII